MIVVAAILIATVVALVLSAMFRAGKARSVPNATDDVHTVASQRRRRAMPRLRRSPHVVLPSAVAAWADDLARSLRHGSTLHAALTHTLPTDDVIEHRSAALRHWLDRGATVVEACDEWADELADPCVRAGRRRTGGDRLELLATMSAVLAATASLGGSAAAPLDRFAVTMRQRSSDDLERSAQSAQAKMSAKVLTSVPIVVLALLLLTDADVRAVIASVAGGAVVALGLGLNTIGALWMRRIAGTDVGVST